MIAGERDGLVKSLLDDVEKLTHGVAVLHVLADLLAKGVKVERIGVPTGDLLACAARVRDGIEELRQ